MSEFGEEEDMKDILEHLGWYPKGQTFADIHYYFICEDEFMDEPSISVQELNDCLDRLMRENKIEQIGELFFKKQ